ncbi:MAG: RNA 2',3'-cyclic phosphodiesterase [Candidatus Thorarchaeota archaeon]
MSETERVRAFLSIDIDDDTLLTRISYLQRLLDTDCARLKLIDRDDIHFTLRFFGDISRGMVEKMHDCLDGFQFHPFDITISGVGAFPSAARPNVVWVGVSRNRELMVRLKEQIDESLRTLGFPSDARFAPHATIARVRSVVDRNRFRENLASLLREEVGTMVVTNFRLTQSVLTPSGPIYNTLWEIPATRM